MSSTAETIDGGFVDPVFDAQAAFKAVMDTMARPGTSVPLGARAQPPAPLAATAGAIALTLCDHDTPLWLDAPLAASSAVRSWLGFHTGAPLVEAPGDAAFALVAEPAALRALADFGQGTQEYPDRSTTLILQVEALTAEPAMLILEGPGIQTSATLAVSPLPSGFVSRWQENRARFPRGVDIILAAPRAVACLPRTTRIREG